MLNIKQQTILYIQSHSSHDMSSSPTKRPFSAPNIKKTWNVHNDLLSNLQNKKQIQDPSLSYDLDATPSILLRGRYALPTLMTPPRPSSGYTEGKDLSQRMEYNNDVANRRATIAILHAEDKWKGKNRKLGNRDIDETLRMEVKQLRKQRLKALYSPNWGVSGNDLPGELEDLSLVVKKTRPRSAHPRLQQKLKKNNLKSRPYNENKDPLLANVKFSNTLKVIEASKIQYAALNNADYNILYDDTEEIFATKSALGRSQRLDKLVDEVDTIEKTRYKKRLRLYRHCKERQWHTLMKLADVMANTRQDGSQGQRMFAALSAGFAANESALVNVEQFVSRCTSFGLPWWQAEPLLRALFVAFDKDFNGYIDWRDFVSALRIVVKPRESMVKRLRMFFSLYCDHTKFMKTKQLLEVITLHVATPQIKRSLESIILNWLADRGTEHGCHINEFFSFLLSKKAEETLRLLAEDWFQAMPDGLRFHIVHLNYKDSVHELQKADDNIKMKKAFELWMGMEENKFFKRWCYAIHLIHCERQGARHFNFTGRHRGLKAWYALVKRRKGNREDTRKADKFMYEWLTMRVFRWWKIMYKFWIKRNIEYERRAIAMIELTRKERSMKILKRYLARRRQKNKAIDYWEKFERRNLLRTWRANVKVIKYQRQIQESSGALRAEMFEKSSDAFVAAQIEKERLEYERKQREEAKRKALEEAEKERWAQQKMEAYEKGEERRKRRLQEEEWARLKAKAKKEQTERVDKMMDRLEISIRKFAEAEALDYMATAEGKKMIALEMQKVRKEGSWGGDELMAEGSPAPVEGEDPDAWNAKQMVWAMNNGKEMVKMIDAVVGEVFFYNVNTGERLGTEALSTRECRKVARTNYINRKVAEALRAMREQRAIDERNALEKKSSTIITCSFRIVYCRRKLKNMAKKVFTLRSDPYTGAPYYYNTQTREKVAKNRKPFALGSYNLALPEWIVMRTEDDQPYYKQTIEPFETQWTKPEGWIPCMRCQVEFAERRCRYCGFDENKGGEVFCLFCWEEHHPKDMPPPNHLYKEVRRMSTYCSMCRTKVATKLCWECGCDTFCTSHFNLMHTAKRRYKNEFASHTAYDI